jgi:Predicted 3-hydroxylacyl-(acyl carrier protein) dehydratase
MLLDRAAIAQYLPHDGAMVLLDALHASDDDHIVCSADPHRPGNPLREGGRLSAWCGIEYAAQAMALHGGLCAASPQTPRRGFLAVARDIVMTRPTLDGLPGELHIRADKLIADSGRSQYRFRIECDGQMIVSGRVTVVLQ